MSDDDHDHDDEFETPPEEYQEYIQRIPVPQGSKPRKGDEKEASIPEIVDALKLTSAAKPPEATSTSKQRVKMPRRKFPYLKGQVLGKTPSNMTKSSRKTTTNEGLDKTFKIEEKSSESVKKPEKGKEAINVKELDKKPNEKFILMPPNPASTVSRIEPPKTIQRPLQTTQPNPPVPMEVETDGRKRETKSSLATRSGRYLRSKIIPRPAVLSAVPPVAPIKSGTLEELQEIIMSSNSMINSISANDSVGFISSNGSTHRSTQAVMSQEGRKSCGTPNCTIPLEELYVESFSSDKDGNISDINSAISLMVRQREFSQQGELEGERESQDSLPTSSLHSVISKSRSKESTASAPSGKLFHMNVITKDNFQRVRWSDAYEHLAIKACLHPITNENISRSRKTLAAVKFVQITSFVNIKTILENCSNLVRLSFANVAVVQKSSFNPKTQPVIPLPHLEELELQEWLYTLTKYEYWILDFLNRGCSFGKLEKFVFQGREHVMDDKKVGKYQKQLRGMADPAVVTKFLIKNSSTLKKVSIGGIGFQLMESPTRFVNQLSKVQLSSFRFDLQTPGVELFLLNQHKLQTLSCTGFLPSFENRPKQWIAQSLDNNYITLSYLGIFPCIISDVSPDKRTNLYTIDCEMFRRCKKLESLFVNITAVYRRSYTERFSCGRIINIRLLPIGLVEIELYAIRFQEQDIDDFFRRLPMFRKLRELVLNSTTPYTVSTVLISNLPLMESLHGAKFFGGEFDDADTMQMIVKKRGTYNMKIGEDGIQITKNDSARPSATVSHRSSVSVKKKLIK